MDATADTQACADPFQRLVNRVKVALGGAPHQRGGDKIRQTGLVRQFKQAANLERSGDDDGWRGEVFPRKDDNAVGQYFTGDVIWSGQCILCIRPSIRHSEHPRFQ